MMRNKVIAKRMMTGTAAAALVLTLAACEQIDALDLPFLNPTNDASTDNLTLPAGSGDTETRDVEAPEVFQKNEQGLWDGRPSLGGVWVAHPDATDPERVLITNSGTGRSVVGALFRRERDNPGPELQVSSDAAEELGLVAGSPTQLSVVALRREEAPVAPPATTDFDAAADGEAAIGLATPTDIAATPLDPIAGAAAAVDAAEAEANLAASLPPLPAAAATAAAAPVAEAALGAPLDARGAISETPEPPVPAVTAGSSSLEKPFIQIGIFSVEENANETAGKLRSDGMSANVIAQESQGNSFWRVLVGPAPNAQDRTAILAKIQALGFNDAYFVSN